MKKKRWWRHRYMTHLCPSAERLKKYFQPIRKSVISKIELFVFVECHNVSQNIITTKLSTFNFDPF